MEALRYFRQLTTSAKQLWGSMTPPQKMIPIPQIATLPGILPSANRAVTSGVSSRGMDRASG